MCVLFRKVIFLFVFLLLFLFKGQTSAARLVHGAAGERVGHGEGAAPPPASAKRGTDAS